MAMVNISILDLSNTLHFKEIVEGFLNYSAPDFRFIEYKKNKDYLDSYVLVFGGHRNVDLVKKLSVRPDKIILYNL